MEDYIQISKINDFLFCPKSLYLHSIYETFSEKIVHSKVQVEGKINHKNIEENKYSTSKRFLVGIYVYSEKYGLLGKIDIYDRETKALIERKTKVKKIYKGYIYQLYAQYFCLKEMGYEVKKLIIHSLKDNKNYYVNLPTSEDEKEFSALLKRIRDFNSDDLLNSGYKCPNNIYDTLNW